MNNQMKKLFIVGVGIVGGCAVLVKVIQDNRSKVNTLIKSVIDTWNKSKGIEEASVVSASPLDEVKPNGESATAS